MSWSQKHTHTHTSLAPVQLSLEQRLSRGICVHVCTCIPFYCIWENPRRFPKLLVNALKLWTCRVSICLLKLYETDVHASQTSVLHPSLLSPLSVSHTHTLLIRERNSVFWENHDFIVSVIVIAFSKLSFKKKCGKMSTSWKQTPASLVNVLSTDCYVHYLKL